MDNYPSTTTRLQELLSEFYAADEHTRPVIKHELLSCYYQLTNQERLTMRSVMEPFISEVEREMLAKDPLAQQASELVGRLVGPVYITKKHN